MKERVNHISIGPSANHCIMGPTEKNALHLRKKKLSTGM